MGQKYIYKDKCRDYELTQKKIISIHEGCYSMEKNGITTNP